MKYSIDTGALLSLACTSCYQTILVEDKLITTEEVKEELKAFAQYADFLGKKAKNILADIEAKRIYREKPKNILLLPLASAETSVFSLGKEKQYTIITDDIHAVRVLFEKEKVTAKPSFILLGKLYQEKRITKEQLVQEINSILTERGWLEGALYEYAKTLMEK